MCDYAEQQLVSTVSWAASKRCIMRSSYNGFVLTDDREVFDAHKAHTYLKTAEWCKGISSSRVEKAARNSWTFSLLSPAEEFSGMARLVTDLATFAYLCDVIIDPQYRGMGLGKWMMQTIHELPVVKELRRVMLATSDMHPLYRKAGYEDITNSVPFMQIYRPDIYKTEELE